MDALPVHDGYCLDRPELTPDGDTAIFTQTGSQKELRPLFFARRMEASVRFDAICCQGIMCDMKTLDAPVLDRLLDPVGRILTPEVARAVVRLRFDPKAQTHIKKLARKCNEGRLTDVERREYETYVYAIDFIAILQAKARNLLKGLKEAE